MEIKDISRVYFVGIGGIGMAALARYFMFIGRKVAGYDRTPSHLTDELISEGAAVSFDDSMDAVPLSFRSPEGTLVVYTPAVPAANIPLTFFRDNGFEVRKRAAVLGSITRDSKSICFSGTHGKTTTSSMCAHYLKLTSDGCNAFLGGILRPYDTNLLLSDRSEFTVVEADEYDRSFHQLTPYIAVVNATDPDHLDIYGTEEAYLESFAHFTELIRPDGFLLMRTGLKLRPRVPEGVKVFTFGRDEGDYHAANVRTADGTITFDFVYPGGTVTDIQLGVPVDINILNAVSALGAVHLAGQLDDVTARRAMSSFKGVERRFEFHLKEQGPDGRVVIDDYAHHPDEVRSSIASVRALYPRRKLTVAFQPHLYTRTRDFAPQFAEALSQADEVILIDIYPAREAPIPGVTSKIIFDRVKCASKLMIPKEDFVDTMKNRKFEVLLTLGAGDLSLEVPRLVSEVTDEK